MRALERGGSARHTCRRRATRAATSTSSATSAGIVDELRAQPGAPASAKSLIRFVPPIGPGTICATRSTPSKLERELGWRPQETFESGLEKTVRWYLENEWWCASGVYAGERLGVIVRGRAGVAANGFE